MKYAHTPVLVEEVVNLMDPHPGELYFDGTAGYGGHAAAIQARTGKTQMILSDRDPQATRALQKRFGTSAQIWHLSFLEAADRLASEHLTPQLILLDLGVSSVQLDEPERGFSFRNEGPIDMRMDPTSAISAGEIVNTYPEAKLADIIGRYGEEHRAKTVARAIVSARPLGSTTQLAEVVRKAAGTGGKIDPATRTFQALRMETNDELRQLEQALPKLTRALAPGGRIAVISFHSLEDRIVKHWFEQESKNCLCPPKQPVCTCNHLATLAKVTKRPISGTIDSHNPRARSAKLRVARKLNKNQKEAL